MNFERRRSPRRCAKEAIDNCSLSRKRTSLDFESEDSNKKQRIDSENVHRDDVEKAMPFQSEVDDTAEPKVESGKRNMPLRDIEEFVRQMVYKERLANAPKKMETEVQEWVNFLTGLVEEYRSKKVSKNFSELIGKEKLHGFTSQRTYGGRVRLFEFLSQKLFKAEMAEMTAFFLAFKGKEFTAEVNRICKKIEEVPTAEVSAEDALQIHFKAKG